MTVWATTSTFGGKVVHLLDRVAYKSTRIGLVFGFVEELSTTGIRQISVWVPGVYNDPYDGYPATPSTTDVERAVDVNGDPTNLDMPYNGTATDPSQLAFGEWMWAP